MTHPSRDAILREASRLFATRDAGSVTMREIAASAGLHLPSLYHFFENKHALHRHCIERAFERGAQTLTGALEPDGAFRTVTDRIDAYVDALCAALHHDAELLAFVCNASLQGNGWWVDSPLQRPLRQFAELIEGACGIDRAQASAAATRVLALALGAALADRALRPDGRDAVDPGLGARKIVDIAVPGLIRRV